MSCITTNVLHNVKRFPGLLVVDVVVCCLLLIPSSYREVLSSCNVFHRHVIASLYNFKINF